MWLAEKIMRTDNVAGGGTVGTVGTGPAVISEIEAGGYELLRHAGIIRLPVEGERYLALDCADGTRVVIGALVSELPEEAEAGEIYAFTDSASVLLKNDGSIVINGSVSIEGSLRVNGTEIGADTE